MKVWIRCSKCHHKQYQEGLQSFNLNNCPKCDHDHIDIKMNGSAPEWWTDEDKLRAALERK